uniref:Uncharacterized protein n=1 Tax=Periophthalmus magnuspinnatus TaxID=409849 RepID=A0A3B4A106_9GOBI
MNIDVVYLEFRETNGAESNVTISNSDESNVTISLKNDRDAPTSNTYLWQSGWEMAVTMVSTAVSKISGFDTLHCLTSVLCSASESPVDTQTPLGSSTTQSSGHTFSSLSASTSVGSTPSVLSSITASDPTTTGGSQSITGPTHQETPSQLNVGVFIDSCHYFKGSGHSSLDPLLAGLLSMFIVTTAVIFVVLFLKFRHQNNNPEFHRLQDLPMDDLMEDTPLSRYTY